MLFDYDDSNEQSILEYAKKIENLTFNDIINQCKEYIDLYDKGLINNRNKSFIDSLKNDKFVKSTNAKGQLGNFIEKYYFGYEPNSDQEADLSKVGIEIKQTPIDIGAKGQMRAGERVSITMISYNSPVEEDFYKSHVWDKIKKILLIHYIRDKSKNRLDYIIKHVNLFTPPINDLKIIIDDYHKINEKIKAGKAHELSEGDTMYLGACTKGSTAEKSYREQYYNPNVKAKSRNFCFKQSYMNYVLNNYIINNECPYESILKDVDNTKTFEQQVIDKLNQYIGKTDKELCEIFDRPYNNNKAQWSDLAYRMLGIRSNKAEEFVKAGIVVKIIRLEENGQNRENLSLPPFKFKELVKEEWDDSTLHNYLETTKFLFVVYKSNGDCYEFVGSKLWNMPYNDLEVIVKEGWLNIKNKLISGVTFKVKTNYVENDLPKKSDNKIIHIRPHASKSAFKLNNGFVKGDIYKDANELPNGEWITTQSFWLNNDYVLRVIEEIVK